MTRENKDPWELTEEELDDPYMQAIRRTMGWCATPLMDARSHRRALAKKLPAEAELDVEAKMADTRALLGHGWCGTNRRKIPHPIKDTDSIISALLVKLAKSVFHRRRA